MIFFVLFVFFGLFRNYLIVPKFRRKDTHFCPNIPRKRPNFSKIIKILKIFAEKFGDYHFFLYLCTR